LENSSHMKILRFIHMAIPLLCCLVCFFPAKAQDTTNKYTDISTVILEQRLTGVVNTCYTDENGTFEEIYPRLNFKPGIQHKGPIPNSWVTKRIFLRFNIFNGSDSIHSVYFCPGYYFSRIVINRLDGTQLINLPDLRPDLTEKDGFRMITLPPHDSTTLVVELSGIKTYNNLLRPRLIGSQHVSAFLAQLHGNYSDQNLITYLFCGLLLMMILFSATNFFQGGNKEFLFYSGYALFMGGLLFLQTVFHLHASPFGYFFEGYFDFLLQATGIIFYMLFMKKFLDTDNAHPFLSRLYNTGIAILLGSMLVYTILHYFTDNYVLEYLTEILTKVLLLTLTVIFLVYSIRNWKEKLLHYLFWGNLFLFIFASISQLGILYDIYFRKLPGLLNSSIFYYELGLFLELVFFLAGLNYKNRRNIINDTKEKETLKAQNLLKEYEKEIAVYKAQQEERQRISADMHDELGAGMTAIRLMSEIARNKMKENTPVEIERISHSADDVLNKMNAIIWSMNSGNDTLDNLVSYIRSYSLEYFDGTPVECRLKVPDTIPSKELAGDKRRNIFLCLKETLNNTLKHAGASLVEIEIKTGDDLYIRITDNGKGIDLDKIRQFGNGLKNISRRMESIGGTYHIENNKGTVTTLILPL
jgi:signal transduction histidine kinase